MEFYEMTCKDIGEFCIARRKKEEENWKIEASIQYRISSRILNGISAKPKNLSFEELFPEFNEKKQFERMTESQKEELIQIKWKDFLGI